MLVLNAASIFSNLPDNLNSLVVFERPTQEETIRIIAVGDVGFSGRIEKYSLENGWENLFREFSPFFRTGQLIFANFENSLSGGQKGELRSHFTPLPECIKTLKSAGFNVMHLANNHILDNGSEGFIFTIDSIRANGMTPLGVGTTRYEAESLVMMKSGKITFGWLACGHTLLKQPASGPYFFEFDEDEILSKIKQARGKVDFLIISIHAGLMFLDFPHPEIKDFSEKAIGSGANLILMHHAHNLQGVQVIGDNGLVCYNMGNFLFDWKEGDIQAPIVVEQQNEGGIFVFDIDQKGVTRFVIIPTLINNDCSVGWAVGERGNNILERMARISEQILGNYSSTFLSQRVQRNSSHIFNDVMFQIKKGNFGYVFSLLKRLRLEHLNIGFRWLVQKIFPQK